VRTFLYLQTNSKAFSHRSCAESYCIWIEKKKSRITLTANSYTVEKSMVVKFKFELKLLHTTSRLERSANFWVSPFSMAVERIQAVITMTAIPPLSTGTERYRSVSHRQQTPSVRTSFGKGSSFLKAETVSFFGEHTVCENYITAITFTLLLRHTYDIVYTSYFCAR